MNSKKIILGLFAMLCILQWFVPLSMMTAKESIIKKGKDFKFQTVPIDPNDPFRGKYINLNYKEADFKVEDNTIFQNNETAYIIIENDPQGYAKIKDVVLNPPQTTDDYVMAKVHPYGKEGKINIRYPFTKFYMDEFKALPAEKVYRESQRDSSQVCYAVVKVLNGKTALLDVMINGDSIKDIVERQQQKNK